METPERNITLCKQKESKPSEKDMYEALQNLTMQMAQLGQHTTQVLSVMEILQTRVHTLEQSVVNPGHVNEPVGNVECNTSINASNIGISMNSATSLGRDSYAPRVTEVS